MSDKNVEVVRRVLEAFVAGVDSGDFAAAWDTGYLAADAQWVAFPELDQATYRGRAGFVEFMRTWSEDFERLSFRIERLILLAMIGSSRSCISRRSGGEAACPSSRSTPLSTSLRRAASFESMPTSNLPKPSTD